MITVTNKLTGSHVMIFCIGIVVAIVKKNVMPIFCRFKAFFFCFQNRRLFLAMEDSYCRCDFLLRRSCKLPPLFIILFFETALFFGVLCRCIEGCFSCLEGPYHCCNFSYFKPSFLPLKSAKVVFWSCCCCFLLCI